MATIHRREFLAALAATTFCGTIGVDHTLAQDKVVTFQDWLDEWVTTKKPIGPLHVARFADPMYVLLKPISWAPNPGQEKYSRVDVPVGFVTDFASIPQIFWSLLPRDGQYSYPAIVHDYLYWTQDRARADADTILKLGMEEFSISAITNATIYNAVRIGGERAWNENAAAKRHGEKRVLKRLPDEPTMTWADWKKKPDVFVE
jgi:hypothetical protein